MLPAAIFETPRLSTRKSTLGDVGFFFGLWTNPMVMANVGFPQGLRITRQEIREKIETQPKSEFDCKLVVTLKTTGEAIGECKLGLPNERGVSETNIKLQPEHWGQGFGVEIKNGLLRYLFTWTVCQSVKATPNVNNIASIRMQESVGGIRVGEGVFVFPEHMQAYTTPVHYYEYLVLRQDWLARHTLTVSGAVRLRPFSPNDIITALPWYQDPDVLKYVDGPGAKPYDLDAVEKMYRCLTRLGECYMIEIRNGPSWCPIGDIAISGDNLPIAIGKKSCWGWGIGKQVLQRVVQRAQELGYQRLVVHEIFRYNQRSLNLYRSVGFREVGKTEKGVKMELSL